MELLGVLDFTHFPSVMNLQIDLSSSCSYFPPYFSSFSKDWTSSLILSEYDDPEACSLIFGEAFESVIAFWRWFSASGNLFSPSVESSEESSSSGSFLVGYVWVWLLVEFVIHLSR